MSVVSACRHAQNLDFVGVVHVEVARGRVLVEAEGRGEPVNVVGTKEEGPGAQAPAERGGDGGDLDAEGGVEVHVCGAGVLGELRITEKENLHGTGVVRSG